MAGINLSQSLQEKQEQAKGRFFDRGFFVTIGGFVLLLAIFGGTRWYATSLETKMQNLDQAVAEKTASLRGKEVNRIADFTKRLEVIQTHLSTEPDPTAALRQLETYTLPAIRLIAYEYDRKEGKVRLEGEANTLKEVAQQMLAFKDIEGVGKITVDRIDYDESGKVVFSFLLIQAKAEGGSSSLP